MNLLNILGFDLSSFAERRNELRLAVVATYIVALARHEWPTGSRADKLNPSKCLANSFAEDSGSGSYFFIV